MKFFSPSIDRDRVAVTFDGVADTFAGVYEQMSYDLIIDICKWFNYDAFMKRPGKKTVSAWRAYMLDQIGQLRRDAIDDIAEYADQYGAAYREALIESIYVGVGIYDRERYKTALSTLVDPAYKPTVTPNVQRICGLLADQAIDRLNLVNTVMLDSTIRKYREMIEEVNIFGQMELTKRLQSMGDIQTALNVAATETVLGESHRTAMTRAVIKCANEGITGFYDARGRQWDAAAYVSMDVRTTTANVARQAMLQTNEDNGNNLIVVSSHAEPRPLCAPYQGAVLSTDGTSGTCTDGDGNAIEYKPLSETSYGEPAGLFGINCGHLPYPFFAGMSRNNMLTYDDPDNEGYYEKQQQRFYERKIRKYKQARDACIAAGDTDTAKELDRNARQQTKALKEWCDERGRVFYPNRVQIVNTHKANKG